MSKSTEDFKMLQRAHELKARHQRPSLEEEDSEDNRNTTKLSFWKADGPKSCKKALQSIKQEISDNIQCHVAVSTADASQQDNFTNPHIILKAQFKIAALGQSCFKPCRAIALQKSRCCGRSESLGNLPEYRSSSQP